MARVVSSSRQGLVPKPSATDISAGRMLKSTCAWADAPRVFTYGVPSPADSLSFAVSAAEQAFASVINIPASALVAGVVVTPVWHMQLTTHGSNVRWRIRLGNISGTILLDTGSISVSTVTNTSYSFFFDVMGTAAASASAPVFVNWMRQPGVGAGSTVTQPISIATNATVGLCLTAQLAANGATTLQCTGYRATIMYPT